MVRISYNTMLYLVIMVLVSLRRVNRKWRYIVFKSSHTNNNL